MIIQSRTSGTQKGAVAAQGLTLTEFQNNRTGLRLSSANQDIRSLGLSQSKVLGDSEPLVVRAWTLKTQKNEFQSWLHHLLVESSLTFLDLNSFILK